MSFYQIRSRERAKYTTVLHRKTGLNIEKQNDSTQRSKLCVFFRFLDLTFERQELLSATNILLVTENTFMVSFMLPSSLAYSLCDRYDTQIRPYFEFQKLKST